VLSRYLPSLRTILSIAANAVVYTFNPSAQSWEKSGVEGTMFVCETSVSTQDRRDGQGTSYAVFILNRRGLNNMAVDLAYTTDVELASELLILRYPDTVVDEQGNMTTVEKTTGLWIHEDKSNTRAVNTTLISTCWEKARASALDAAERAAQGVSFGEGEALGEGSLRGLNGNHGLGGVDGVGGNEVGRGPVKGQRIDLQALFGRPM
jgi:hypothetical protein